MRDFTTSSAVTAEMSTRGDVSVVHCSKVVYADARSTIWQCDETSLVMGDLTRVLKGLDFAGCALVASMDVSVLCFFFGGSKFLQKTSFLGLNVSSLNKPLGDDFLLLFLRLFVCFVMFSACLTWSGLGFSFCVARCLATPLDPLFFLLFLFLFLKSCSMFEFSLVSKIVAKRK